jgi:AP-1 complex subunit gamma-1
MPPPEIREEQRVLGPSTKKRTSKILKDKSRKPVKQAEQDMLLDLMGGSDVPATSPTTNGSQNTADLLADILGDSGLSSPAPQPSQQPTSMNTSAIMDLFGSNGGTPSPQPATASASLDLLAGAGAPVSTPSPSAPPAYTAFNKNDLVLSLQVQRGNNTAQIQARFRNDSSFSHFSNVGLQAAVPKSQRLQLSAINKGELDAGEEGVQMLKVTALTGVSRHFFPSQVISVC